MIPILNFPGGCGLRGEGRALLIALALSLAGLPGAAQTAAEAACAAAPPGNTQTTPGVCAAGDTRQDAAMMEALKALSAHGLDPAAYTAGGASARSAWLLAATHLGRGVLEAKTRAPRTMPDKTAEAALDTGAADLRAALEAFAPATPIYAALKAELQRQQYAQATSADPETQAAAGGRIAKLQISLEHLRWLPREAAERQIYANIPTYEVVAFAGGAEASRHVAIFGAVNRQTPEFSDTIKYLEFSPWWNVPASMARADKLAQFQRDPGDIQRLDYRILDAAGKRVDTAGIDWDKVTADAFPYRIRQAPGPHNALGQVKFMFPNADSIYLHDTPDQGLFARTQRAISAGCVRVQDAVALSEWVMEETPKWDRVRIDAAIASGTATRATLAAPVPIHIVYLTAFPAADGSITYAPDVYGLDGAVQTELAAYAPPPARPAATTGAAE